MARTKINDKQLEKIVSSDKVAGGSINITGSSTSLSTLTGGDHFLVQSGSSDPVKITADVMQDFFSLTDIHNSSADEVMHITFVSGSGNGKKLGIDEDSALTYNPSSNLLIASGNVRSARFEIDSAADYLDVSTNLQIVAAADILLDPGGGDVKVDGNLLPNADDTSDLGSTSLAWQDIHLEGDILAQDAMTVSTAAGDLTIDSIAGSAVVDGHTGVTVKSTNSGDITLDPASNDVLPGADSEDNLGRDGGTTTSNIAGDFSESSDFATLGLGGNLLKNSIGHIRITTSGLNAVTSASMTSGDSVTISQSGNVFTATVADTPSATRTIVNSFQSAINDSSVSGGTSALDITSNSATFQDVVVGDTIELAQFSPSSATFSATIASISSTSIGLSSVSISGASSIDISNVATAQIKGNGIPVSSASIDSGSAFTPSLGASVTFSRSTTFSRVAWKEIFVDNVHLNGQGEIKLDDDGDTTISAVVDDVMEFQAGAAHVMSLSGSSVNVLTAFSGSSTATLGGNLTVEGDVLPLDSAAKDLGSSAQQWRDLYIDGAAHIDALGQDLDAGGFDIENVNQLTASAIKVTNLDVVTINSITETATTLEIQDKLIVSALSASVGAAIGGGLRVGAGDDSDGYFSILLDSGSLLGHKIDFNVQVSDGGAEVTQVFVADGLLAPETNNDVSLGTATKQFKDLHLDGTANIDALVADSAKISDLTDNRLVIAGAAGELEDSANLTYDGSTFTVSDSANLGGAETDVITSVGRLTASAGLDITGGDSFLVAASVPSTFSGQLTASNGISVSTPEVTFAALDELSASVGSSNHFVLVQDSGNNLVKKENIKDLVGSVAGAGLQDESGVLSIQPVIELATKFTRGSILSEDFRTASLQYDVVSGSLQVYLNGMLQTPSGSASGDGPQDYTGVASGSAAHSEGLFDYRHVETTGSHSVLFVEALDEDDVVQLRYLKK